MSPPPLQASPSSLPLRDQTLQVPAPAPEAQPEAPAGWEGGGATGTFESFARASAQDQAASFGEWGLLQPGASPELPGGALMCRGLGSLCRC